MAIVEWTQPEKGTGKLVALWEALAANDDGATLTPQGARSLASCVQFSGTFGGTIHLKHSNDGVTWYIVNDLSGSPISVTAAGLHQFSSAARYLRPEAEAGIVDVDVLMVLRG